MRHVYNFTCRVNYYSRKNTAHILPCEIEPTTLIYGIVGADNCLLQQLHFLSAGKLFHVITSLILRYISSNLSTLVSTDTVNDNSKNGAVIKPFHNKSIFIVCSLQTNVGLTEKGYSIIIRFHFDTSLKHYFFLNLVIMSMSLGSGSSLT